MYYKHANANHQMVGGSLRPNNHYSPGDQFFLSAKKNTWENLKSYNGIMKSLNFLLQCLSRIGIGLISLFSFWLRINQVDVKMYSPFRRAGQSAHRGWAKLIHIGRQLHCVPKTTSKTQCSQNMLHRPKNNVAKRWLYRPNFHTSKLKEIYKYRFWVDGFVKRGNT